MELYSNILPYVKKCEEQIYADLRNEEPTIYGMLPQFIARGGKRIRPVLCFLSCGVVGGKYDDVTEIASIIEQFHNFSLIHDDIEDNSLFRRGEPTLHISHGLAMALNSGDALYTLLWRRLANLHMDPKRHIDMFRLCSGGFKKVVDGQGVEIAWIKNGRFDISEKEYFTMIGGKTAALLGLSAEAGAVIGGAGKTERDKLRRYGEKLGLAFQIHDDVLNLTGDFEKYQKEIGGDIAEGKRSLIVVHFLAHAKKEDKEKMISLLKLEKKTEQQIQEAIRLLKSTNSIEYASKHAIRLVEEAKGELAGLKESKDKTALIGVADYTVLREK